MKATTTWFLIADGARARVVVNDGPGRGVRPALEHEFAASHAPTRDWNADKPGRSSGANGGTGHSVEPKTDAHQFAKERFAAEMAGMLDAAAKDRAFDRLVLVAPPKVLGTLRASLANGARERVFAEVPKDLTHVPDRNLPGHLESVMVL